MGLCLVRHAHVPKLQSRYWQARFCRAYADKKPAIAVLLRAQVCFLAGCGQHDRTCESIISKGPQMQRRVTQIFLCRMSSKAQGAISMCYVILDRAATVWLVLLAVLPNAHRHYPQSMLRAATKLLPARDGRRKFEPTHFARKPEPTMNESA